jgi:hypothetical protein
MIKTISKIMIKVFIFSFLFFPSQIFSSLSQEDAQELKKVITEAIEYTKHEIINLRQSFAEILNEHPYGEYRSIIDAFNKKLNTIDLYEKKFKDVILYIPKAILFEKLHLDSDILKELKEDSPSTVNIENLENATVKNKLKNSKQKIFDIIDIFSDIITIIENERIKAEKQEFKGLELKFTKIQPMLKSLVKQKKALQLLRKWKLVKRMGMAAIVVALLTGGFFYGKLRIMSTFYLTIFDSMIPFTIPPMPFFD